MSVNSQKQIKIFLKFFLWIENAIINNQYEPWQNNFTFILSW